MQEYTFHYGRGTKSFSLDETRVIKEVDMPQMTPLTDIRQAVLEAIYHPIGMAPINEVVKPGDTITFICNDPTRVANSFDFMPVLVNEMNKLGVPDENMQIVFSLGTHRLMTQEEMAEGVGKEVAANAIMDAQNFVSRVTGHSQKNKQKATGLRGFLQRVAPVVMILAGVAGFAGVTVSGQMSLPIALAEQVIRRYDNMSVENQLIGKNYMKRQLNL